MEPLLSLDWLHEHLRDRDLRIFDATVQVHRRLKVPTLRTGLREWRREHIPRSGFASLFELSDPDAARRTLTLPTPQWFAARVGALGVDNDSQVVLYDRRESMWAARLWWMFRVFGFDSCAVLDGGWAAWLRSGLPVCSDPCGYRPATFRAGLRPGLVVDKRQVAAALDDPEVCVVDALGHRQHRGEVNEWGRRGHIPGSRNVSAWEILDRETGCYRPLPELERKLEPALEARRAITYCGSGAAAASVAHALVRLGHPDVAIYEGGMLEWCADPHLPLETGG
jgi:thiosulfate/3-mercaptopyruvate sulfurtransferase